MKTKTKVILGVVLTVVAGVLFLVAGGNNSPSVSIPAPSSSPNDPAIKGLNFN